MTKKTILLVILVSLVFSFSAYANVLKETGKVCFHDEDKDGFSEKMTFPMLEHNIFSAYPDDPLGDYAGMGGASCPKPKSYAEFPAQFMTGTKLYDPPSCGACGCTNGDWEMQEQTIDDGYKLFILDEATCSYTEVLRMDVVIYKAALSNWCPVAKFAFEFNNAEINNIIGSDLLDYFASQPVMPPSWGEVKITASGALDIGTQITSGKEFCEDAEFTHLPGVVCRGCDNCGVESNGRMMTAMAKHHYMHGKAAICSDPSGEGVLCATPKYRAVLENASFLRAKNEIDIGELFPNFADLGLKAVPSTPESLVAITNAKDIASMDHFKDGTINGSFLLMETENRVYEHTKAVCDRASGDALVHVIDVMENGTVFHVAVLSDVKKKKRDFAISFVVADGKVYSRWRLNDYPEFEGEKVYNIQLWSASFEETKDFLKAELDRLEQVFGELKYDTEYVQTQANNAYFLAGDKNGLEAKFFLGGQVKENLHMEATYWPETDANNPKTIKIEMDKSGKHTTKIPAALDMSVKLVNNSGRVLDEVYLTDGAFTTFDDSEFTAGTSETTATINTNAPEAMTKKEEDFIVTGCADLEGKVDNYAVITRTLAGGASPYNLNNFGEISFTYRSNEDVVLCLESLSRYGLPQSCTKLPAAFGWREISVALSDFTIYQKDEKAVLDDIVALSWNAWNPDRKQGAIDIKLGVKNVTIRKSARQTEDSAATGFNGGGCSQQVGFNLTLALMLLMSMIFVSRRKVQVRNK